MQVSRSDTVRIVAAAAAPLVISLVAGRILHGSWTRYLIVGAALVPGAAGVARQKWGPPRAIVVPAPARQAADVGPPPPTIHEMQTARGIIQADPYIRESLRFDSRTETEVSQILHDISSKSVLISPVFRPNLEEAKGLALAKFRFHNEPLTAEDLLDLLSDYRLLLGVLKGEANWLSASDLEGPFSELKCSPDTFHLWLQLSADAWGERFNRSSLIARLQRPEALHMINDAIALSELSYDRGVHVKFASRHIPKDSRDTFIAGIVARFGPRAFHRVWKDASCIACWDPTAMVIRHARYDQLPDLLESGATDPCNSKPEAIIRVMRGRWPYPPIKRHTETIDAFPIPQEVVRSQFPLRLRPRDLASLARTCRYMRSLLTPTLEVLYAQRVPPHFLIGSIPIRCLRTIEEGELAELLEMNWSSPEEVAQMKGNRKVGDQAERNGFVDQIAAKGTDQLLGLFKYVLEEDLIETSYPDRGLCYYLNPRDTRAIVRVINSTRASKYMLGTFLWDLFRTKSWKGEPFTRLLWLIDAPLLQAASRRRFPIDRMIQEHLRQRTETLS